ncbi:hypothetical protein D3C76_1092700 [compost metagenome]
MVQVVLAGSQDHDRGGRLAANRPAHLQAAQARKHQVEHHQCGLEMHKGLQCLVSTMHAVHLEAVFGQKVRNQASQFQVILDQQYLDQSGAFHGVSTG